MIKQQKLILMMKMEYILKYAYYESVVEEQTFGYMLITMEGENHFYTMNFGCYKKDLRRQ